MGNWLSDLFAQMNGGAPTNASSGLARLLGTVSGAPAPGDIGTVTEQHPAPTYQVAPGNQAIDPSATIFSGSFAPRGGGPINSQTLQPQTPQAPIKWTQPTTMPSQAPHLTPGGDTLAPWHDPIMMGGYGTGIFGSKFGIPGAPTGQGMFNTIPGMGAATNTTPGGPLPGVQGAPQTQMTPQAPHLPTQGQFTPSPPATPPPAQAPQRQMTMQNPWLRGGAF